MINVNALIEEVRKRHNVIIDKSDPIFITVTLNELMVEQFTSAIHEHVYVANKEFTAALDLQVRQAKDTAGRIITDSSEFASEQIKKAIKSAISELDLPIKFREEKVKTPIVPDSLPMKTVLLMVALAAILGAAIVLIARHF